MIVILILVAGFLVFVNVAGWSIGTWLGYLKDPQRMARKHPESVDPATGEQRILGWWRDGEWIPNTEGEEPEDYDLKEWGIGDGY